MPTRGRPAFAKNSLAMFTRQSYANRELVIVDDEERPSFTTPPEGCVYARLPELTIGAKRNRAVEIASGPVIMHWDDDDEYSDDRIAHQAEELRASGKLVAGFHTILFRDLENGDLWRYSGGSPNFIVGTSLCYRRDYWRGNPFHDKQVGEDNSFSLPARNRCQSHASDGRKFITASLHPGNTSHGREQRFSRPNQWRREAEV